MVAKEYVGGMGLFLGCFDNFISLISEKMCFYYYMTSRLSMIHKDMDEQTPKLCLTKDIWKLIGERIRRWRCRSCFSCEGWTDITIHNKNYLRVNVEQLILWARKCIWLHSLVFIPIKYYHQRAVKTNLRSGLQVLNNSGRYVTVLHRILLPVEICEYIGGGCALAHARFITQNVNKSDNVQAFYLQLNLLLCSYWIDLLNYLVSYLCKGLW